MYELACDESKYIWWHRVSFNNDKISKDDYDKISYSKGLIKRNKRNILIFQSKIMHVLYEKLSSIKPMYN